MWKVWFALFSALNISSYPQLSARKAIIFSLKVCDSTLERSGKVRFRPNGEGIHGLEGLGCEGWRVVVVRGGWGMGENPIPKACTHEFPTQRLRISPSLTSLMLIHRALG